MNMYTLNVQAYILVYKKINVWAKIVIFFSRYLKVVQCKYNLFSIFNFQNIITKAGTNLQSNSSTISFIEPLGNHISQL